MFRVCIASSSAPCCGFGRGLWCAFVCCARGVAPAIPLDPFCPCYASRHVQVCIIVCVTVVIENGFGVDGGSRVQAGCQRHSAAPCGSSTPIVHFCGTPGSRWALYRVVCDSCAPIAVPIPLAATRILKFQKTTEWRSQALDKLSEWKTPYLAPDRPLSAPISDNVSVGFPALCAITYNCSVRGVDSVIRSQRSQQTYKCETCSGRRGRKSVLALPPHRAQVPALPMLERADFAQSPPARIS